MTFLIITAGRDATELNSLVTPAENRWTNFEANKHSGWQYPLPSYFVANPALVRVSKGGSWDFAGDFAGVFSFIKLFHACIYLNFSHRWPQFIMDFNGANKPLAFLAVCATIFMTVALRKSINPETCNNCVIINYWCGHSLQWRFWREIQRWTRLECYCHQQNLHAA